MIRSVLAVACGFFAMTLVVGAATVVAVRAMLPKSSPGARPRPTPVYLTVNLIYSCLAAASGGYVAALLAGRNPIAHAGVLAGIVLIMGLVSMKLYEDQQPRWYQVTLLALMPFFAAAGGFLRSFLAGK
ncbi:MAG: hypothetical protein ABJC07_04765 [Acidobacteriota bacterium]